MVYDLSINVTQESLIIADRGEPFDQAGIISICSSHQSAKDLDNIILNKKWKDEKLINNIKDRELKTYKNDPNRIISDFKNIDQITQDYQGRYLWELFQNTDDSLGKKNNKKPNFIGTKGVGFKSVFEITEQPEIYSGKFNFKLSSIETQKELQKIYDNEKINKQAPFSPARIPHSITSLKNKNVKKLLALKFSTIINLPFKDDNSRDKVIKFLENLDYKFLLFSQHLKTVEISILGKKFYYKVKGSKNPLDETELTIESNKKIDIKKWKRWTETWKDQHSGNQKIQSLCFCLPIQKKKNKKTYFPLNVSNNENCLHVFYPTPQDIIPFPILIHGSFEMKLDRNAINDWKLEEQKNIFYEKLEKKLIQILHEIDPVTVVNIFAKEINSKNIVLKLFLKKILETVQNTKFIPTISGKKCSPIEAKLWNYNLALILNVKKPEVLEENLTDVSLKSVFTKLELLGSPRLTIDQQIHLMKYCKNKTLNDCKAVFNVIKNTVKHIGIYDIDHFFKFDEIPCWYTQDKKIICSNNLILLNKPEEWPEWIDYSLIHQELYKHINLLSNKFYNPVWNRAVKKKILSTNKDYLYEGLLNVVTEWEDEDWSKNGFDAIYFLSLWLDRKEIQDCEIFVKGVTEDTKRETIIKSFRVPDINNTWVDTLNCYCDRKIEYNSNIKDFAEQNNRNFILPKKKWRNKVNKKDLRNLLIYLGVSFEPKIFSTNAWAKFKRDEFNYSENFFDLWKEFENQRGYNIQYNIKDWIIEDFPESLFIFSNSSENAFYEIISKLNYVVKYIVANASDLVIYRKRSYGKNYLPGRKFISLIKYLFLKGKYFRCENIGKETFFSSQEIIIPYEIESIGALKYFIPIPNISEKNIKIYEKVLFDEHLLNIQRTLPKDYSTWVNWLNNISKINNKDKISSTDLQKIYMVFFDICNTPNSYDDRPSNVFCTINNKYQITEPENVYWIDKPEFNNESIKNALSNQKIPLFVLSLSEAEKSGDYLGINRLSSILTSEFNEENIDNNATERINKIFHNRKKAIKHLAKLEDIKFLHGKLKIKVVTQLKVKYLLNGKFLIEDKKSYFINNNEDLIYIQSENIFTNLSFALSEKFEFNKATSGTIDKILSINGYQVLTTYLNNLGIDPSVLDVEKISEEIYLRDSISNLNTENIPLERSEEVEFEDNLGISNNEDVESKKPEHQTTNNQNRQDKGHKIKNKDTLNARTTFHSETENEFPEEVAEKGRQAENWLFHSIKSRFSDCIIKQNVRDDENKETDILITNNNNQDFHIEVKRVESGAVYWSELQFKKAMQIEDKYFMALLIPKDNNYAVYWSWSPRKDLSKIKHRKKIWRSKKIHEDNTFLSQGEWDYENKDYPKIDAKMSYKIIINEELLKSLDKDEDLKLLSEKISK